MMLQQAAVRNGLGIDASRPYRFGFILQLGVGWSTFYRNFRHYADQDTSVEPAWTEVTHYKPGGIIERLPGVPHRLTSAMRGTIQVHQGLGAASLPAIGGAIASRYDAVLVNSPYLCRTTRGHMRRVPTVIQTDASPRQFADVSRFYGRAQATDTFGARYKHRAYVDILTSASYIASCSHWTKRSLVSDYGVSEERVVVVPFGVDVERWVPPQTGVREMSLRQSGGLPRILFVGGDFQRKGGQLLLDWFLERGRERCELHMVTRTPPVLAESVRGLHLYTGLDSNDPRLIQLYRESHLFVLPTQADFSPIASIEAMATGLPVITTNVGGIEEIVEDGSQGFLIAPDDGAQLASRLDLLLSDAHLRAKLGDQARQRVLRAFDARHNAKTVLDLMKRATRCGQTGAMWRS
jgi:glycosyltransferase involved in cell wall biosynthesis